MIAARSHGDSSLSLEIRRESRIDSTVSLSTASRLRSLVLMRRHFARFIVALIVQRSERGNSSAPFRLIKNSRSLTQTTLHICEGECARGKRRVSLIDSPIDLRSPPTRPARHLRTGSHRGAICAMQCKRERERERERTTSELDTTNPVPFADA